MKRYGYGIFAVAALLFGGWIGSNGVAAAAMQCGIGDVCLGPFRVSTAQPSDTEVLTWSDSNNQWEPSAAAGGSSDIISEGDSSFEIIDLGTGTAVLTLNGSNAFTVGTSGTPTTEISNAIGNVIRFTNVGLQFNTGGSPSFLEHVDTGGFYIQAGMTATVPGYTRADDKDTGFSIGSDVAYVVAGGVTGLSATELSSGVVLQYQTTAGITASTTQTQGEQPLVSTFNEVATVANTNDTVTLPSALAGSLVVIINNGANTLQIFPASSDNLGAGVDTATTLASGSNVRYCAYDATNWESC